MSEPGPDAMRVSYSGDADLWDRIDGHYFDRQGRPISLRQWAKKREADQRVAETELVTSGGRRVWVSTVWLGIDHAFFGGPPIIFETMAFPVENGGFVPTDLDMDRYATERDAFRGHEEMVGKFAQDWWLDLGGRA